MPYQQVFELKDRGRVHGSEIVDQSVNLGVKGMPGTLTAELFPESLDMRANEMFLDRALFEGGSESRPSITFRTDIDTGIYSSLGGLLEFTTNGSRVAAFGTSSAVFGGGAGNVRIQFGAGSPAAPNYSFDGDEDTGIYRQSTNLLSISTGGVRRVGISAIGWVFGAGTTGNATIQLGAGSAANPIYTFDGDEDTGIYRQSTNLLSVSTGGVRRVGISAIGWVFGAGTTGNATIQLGAGSAANPIYTFDGDEDTGLYRSASDVLGITTGGDDAARIGTGRILFRRDIDADDGSTGEVEIFPKGTLIAMNTSASEASQAVGSSEGKVSATEVTVSCDYANQPVFVDVTITVYWRLTSHDSLYRIRPGVNGGAVGIRTALRWQDTGASGDGVDVSGSTGADGHTHGIDSDFEAWNIVLAAHSSANPLTDSDSHSHGSGTLSVNGDHQHSVAFTNAPDSIRWTGAATADGNGNITLSIFATGDGTAEISAHQIAYAVWRR